MCGHNRDVESGRTAGLSLRLEELRDNLVLTAAGMLAGRNDAKVRPEAQAETGLHRDVANIAVTVP